MGFASPTHPRSCELPLRIAGGAWSKAVAVTVRCIASIAARAVSADIPHALGCREIARCAGPTAPSDPSSRHSDCAAPCGGGEDTDRERFHATPPSVAHLQSINRDRFLV